MKTTLLQKLLVTCASIPLVAGVAAATTLHATPSDDAMILTNAAGAGSSSASGHGPGMFAGADGNGSLKRSLVKFDLSSIPTTATVSSVELDLYIGQIAGSGGMGPGCGTMCSPATREFDLYEVDYNHTWHEGETGATAYPTTGASKFTQVSPTINGTGQGYAYASCLGTGSGPSCGSDVTWEWYYYDAHGGGSNAWHSAPSDQDYGSAAFGSPSFGDHNAVGAWSFSNFLNNQGMAFTGNTTSDHAAFTAVVQDWVAHPAHNNGFEIRGPALELLSTSFIGWWTKDGAAAAGSAGLTPVLTVNY